MTDIVVTEKDRKAYLSLNMLPELDQADVRAGRWDNVTGIQAFARHRIQARREALEEAAGVAEDHDTFDRDTVISARQCATALDIATAIRAKATPQA